MANKEQLKILKQGVEVWNQWRKEHRYEKIDLRRANLRRANLGGANLCEAKLYGTDLYKAYLGGANLSRADLNRATLNRTNLSGATLSRVNLNGATLSETNLREADLYGANLSGANLHAADLRGANLFEAHLRGVHLCTADLSKAGLRAADLRAANLENAIFRDAQEIPEWILQGLDDKGRYSQERLIEAMRNGFKNLLRASLNKADLREADLREADLREADFIGASLIQTNLSHATITGVCLYGTARDDWIIDGIICDYVYWDLDGKERSPKDRDFNPGEFEEMYKQLPTFEYIFEHGFTALDAVVMSRIVEAINKEHPEFELDLVSFDKRGQPHAKFTVLHKEVVEEAKSQVTTGYETRIKALEGQMEEIQKRLAMLGDQPKMLISHFTVSGGEVTMGDTHIGRDHIEIKDNANVNRVTTGDSFHDQAQKIINTPPSDISKEEIVKLIALVQQELQQSDDIPEETKEEALAEIKTAEVQAKKDKPDNPKLVERLTNAKNVLTEMGGVSEKAVMIGHLLVKAIAWITEHWDILT